MQIREQYAALETAKYGRSWTDKEFALESVGDVDDLAKLVTARSGVGNICGTQLEHELADCLWSVMVLADRYEIDVEKAFLKMVDELGAHIVAASVGLSKEG